MSKQQVSIKNTLTAICLALFNAGCFHLAYIGYLEPVFSYAGFINQAPTAVAVLLTYILTAIPTVFWNYRQSPNAAGVALLFILYYVPIQFSFLFIWAHPSVALWQVQATLTCCMSFVFAVANVGWSGITEKRSFRTSVYIMWLITVAAIVLIAFEYRDGLRIVTFDQVYEHRAESTFAKAGWVTGYLMMWLTYCLIPLHLARALISKKYASGFIALAAGVLVYAATAAKVGLLIPVFVVLVYAIMASGGKLFQRLLFVFSCVTFLLTLAPDEMGLQTLKSAFLMRGLGSNGWITVEHATFFSDHGYTYYSHVRPIDWILGIYPYGELSPGQVVGANLTGTPENNFNAGIWGTDGFAALGLIGVPLATVAMCIWIFISNRAASGLPTTLGNLWFLGFWLALMNGPLSTSILSAGGALTLVLLWSGRATRSKVSNVL